MNDASQGASIDAVDALVEMGARLLAPDDGAPLDMAGGRERTLARLLLDRRALDVLPLARAAFAARVEAARVRAQVPATPPYRVTPAPVLDRDAALALARRFAEPPAGDVIAALHADVAERRLRGETT